MDGWDGGGDKGSFKLMVMIAGHNKLTTAHSLLPLSKRKLYHCDQPVKPDSSIPFKSKSRVPEYSSDINFAKVPKKKKSVSIRLSEAEKAKRARKAVATHYRNHPELREKNKLAKRASRAAKKLAKRKWDPPKKQKVVTEEIMSDEEILTSDEEHEDLEEYPKFDSPIRGPRQPSPQRLRIHRTIQKPQGEDEEVASQVLTSMYLARQHQMQSLSVGSHSGTRALGVHRLTGTLTTPKCDGRAGREPSEGDSLPPSSPPPISPADPRQARQVIAGEVGGLGISRRVGRAGITLAEQRL
ncbi:hypothetical protein DFH09DRAFT_1113857 [Mycena vulgaris]|nr:hypothetical protein DFH09DRAFT_1113857 [Mycena vulgaris]